MYFDVQFKPNLIIINHLVLNLKKLIKITSQLNMIVESVNLCGL